MTKERKTWVELFEDFIILGLFILSIFLIEF